MTIRRATNQDADAVRKLVFDVLRAYGLKPDPAATDRDLEDIEKNYFQNRGSFSVLEGPGGELIGSYGLLNITSDSCELRKMYLHPDFRGKGYGKMLLEHALLTAKNLGYERVTLETASVLQEAIALYKKYGFEPYTAEHLSPRCDQAYRKILN